MKKRNYLFKLTLLFLAVMTTGATVLHAQGERITFTTTKAVGASIELRINAAAGDQDSVWIDLDNDGTKDTGEAVTVFGSDDSASVNYTIAAQTLTLYGKVTSLNCSSNQLETLDVSQNTALTKLNSSYNYHLENFDVSQNTALTECLVLK